MIDNNEFKDLGNFWDDDSSSWGTEDLNDLHRLLDDGVTVPSLTSRRWRAAAPAGKSRSLPPEAAG